MDIIDIIDDIIKFYQSNPVMAAAVAVVLVVLLIKKPKLTLGVIFIIAFWGVVMYMISRLFEAGIFENN